MAGNKQTLVIKNKKASFEYNFLITLKAGIMLTGTEVKSIREGKASLSDAYCLLTNGELWINPRRRARSTTVSLDFFSPSLIVMRH